MVGEVVELVDDVWAGLTGGVGRGQVAAAAYCDVELVEAAPGEEWGGGDGSALEKRKHHVGVNVTPARHRNDACTTVIPNILLHPTAIHYVFYVNLHGIVIMFGHLAV